MAKHRVFHAYLKDHLNASPNEGGNIRVRLNRGANDSLKGLEILQERI